MQMYNPPHPGKVVREFLGDTTVTEAARLLGVSRPSLSNVLNGSAGISPEMAVKFSKLFDTSAEVWMGIQMQYDLWQARKAGARVRPLPRPHAEARTAS